MVNKTGDMVLFTMLRYGNWVRHSTRKCPYRVRMISKKKIGYHLNNITNGSDRLYYERLCNLEYVPLIPETLVSNGFTWNEKEHVYEYSEPTKDGLSRASCKVSFYANPDDGILVMVSDGIYTNVFNIFYVHELQNALMFSILFNHGENIQITYDEKRDDSRESQKDKRGQDTAEGGDL